MCKEYTHRYGSVHATQKVLEYLQKNIPNLPNKGFTKPYQAMPDECKNKDVTIAYKNYYQHPKKKHINAWTKRDVPEWFKTPRIAIN